MEVTLRATRFRPFLNVFAYFILDPLDIKEMRIKVKNTGKNNLIVLLSTLVIFIGCSPCFNTMQTARMLKPKTVEITPNYNWYGDFKDEYNWSQYSYGCRIGVGLTNKISLYGHYGIVEFGQRNNKDYWSKINIIGLGLKFKMTKPEDNKTLAALYIPVGTYFENISDKIDYFQIQPTMILTRQIKKKLDILGSTVLAISKVRDSDINVFIAQNIGIDLHLKNTGFSLRPEIGVGIGEGSNPLYQYGIGLSYAPSGYSK